MAGRTYYDILGVDRTASVAEIKTAYRRLAMAWHPDRNHAPNATARFREINEAYQCLSVAELRRRYDDGLAREDARSSHAHGGAEGFHQARAEEPEFIVMLTRIWHELDGQLARLPETLLGVLTRLDEWLRGVIAAYAAARPR